MFGSGTRGSSDTTLAINGRSSATGGWVGGASVDEVEATLDASSVLGSCFRFFVDCFLAREKKGKMDDFWALAFRRAGSAAVGSSSGCINWGKRGFEEDEAEISVMVGQAREEETSGEGSSGHWGIFSGTGQGSMSITIHPSFNRPMMSSSSHRLLMLLRRAALQSTTHRRLSSTVSATKRGQCPKCHSPLPTPLPACPKCSYISRVPSNIRYHEMFDLPPNNNPFRVDDKQLTRRFRKLQQTIHPDAWSAKGKVRIDTGTNFNVPF